MPVRYHLIPMIVLEDDSEKNIISKYNLKNHYAGMHFQNSVSKWNQYKSTPNSPNSAQFYKLWIIQHNIKHATISISSLSTYIALSKKKKKIARPLKKNTEIKYITHYTHSLFCLFVCIFFGSKAKTEAKNRERMINNRTRRKQIKEISQKPKQSYYH